MEIKNYFAQDAQGNIMPSAKCYLYLTGTTTLATGLVDGDGIPISNPFLASGMGQITFGAPNGVYDLRVALGARDWTIKVQCADMVQAMDVMDSILGSHAENPTTRNNGQPLEPGDETWNSTDKQPYWWNGADWVALNSSAQQLEERLGSDTGADLVKLDGRSVADTIRDTINVNDGRFGAIGSTGLPVYHPLSERYATLAAAQEFYPFVTSLDQSIDWAAIQLALFSLEGKGGVARGPSQFYVLTDPLKYPDAVFFEGSGFGFWDTVYPNRPKSWGGTNLMLYGTGPKNYSRRGITSMSTAGGVRSLVGGGEARLSTLMNDDATGDTPATPKQLSVFASGKERVSKSWGIRNCRIVPWIGTDGISEYSNPAFTGLAADWDNGACLEDAEFVILENVQIVGYYRHRGLMLNNPDYDVFGGQERNRLINVRVQGGLSVRSGDVRKVEALTASTIEILWDAESFWEPSGVLTGFPASVFQQYSYTSLSRNGANLVFNGVSPDPTIQNLSQLRSPRRGSGAAGTVFRDCFIHGLDHTNGGKAEDYGLPPSCAFEASGFPLRGLAFDNTKIQSRETGLYHFHDCQDFLFDQCQAEGGGYRIASPFPGNSSAPAPSGETRNLRLHSTYGFESTHPEFTPRNRTDDTASFNGTGLNAGLDIRSPDKNPLTFSSFTNGEVARVTDVGFLGVGVTVPAQKLHVGIASAEIARFERLSSSGVVGLQFKNTLGTVSMRLAPSADNAGSFSCSGNGTISSGTASFPWSGGFTTTAFTVTSDRNLKEVRGELSDAEIRAWARVRAQIFQLTQSIEAKDGSGNEARLHAGYIAQDVRDAFLAEGLDPARYALWCEDAKYKTVTELRQSKRPKVGTYFEPREAVEIRDGVPTLIRTTERVERQIFTSLGVVDESGNQVLDEGGQPRFASVPVLEDFEESVEVEVLDGTKLGLRYEQCLVFETAYLRSIVSALDDRVAILEG